MCELLCELCFLDFGSGEREWLPGIGLRWDWMAAFTVERFRDKWG
jgi:hypothetical protein